MFYVSYDGVEEPLGRSQVLGYLKGLAGAYDITLISFERSVATPRALGRELAEAGIVWHPLRYHRRPAVASTTWDVLAGRRALIRAARSGRPAIVHARSDVPALMALWARRATGGEFLFDIRGFWADERVDGDLWRPGGVLYRLAKRYERSFFAEADAIVTLTHASVPHLRAWTGGRPLPIEVIPTCVDIERFSGRPERPGGPHVVWSGSVGTWYRFDLAPRLAAALSLPLTVITRQAAQARRLLDGHRASVRSAAPDRVPAELFAGDIGLCLIRSSFSKVASAPTRFAEYLAAGMPVVVTRGVGDLEAIVEARGVGVVLQGDDEESITAAAARVRALAGDPDLPGRCVRLARERFDLETGTARYSDLYRRLLDVANGT